MAFLPFKKKKKTGSSSQISKIKSPYLRKPFIPNKKVERRRSKKKIKFFLPHSRQKSKPGKLRKTIIIFLFFLCCGAGTYFVFFSDFFNIQEWETEFNGNLLENDDPANNILKNEKNKNLLFLDEKKIIEQFFNLYPDIKTITIKKIFPNKIKIEFEKYPVVANLLNIITEDPSQVSACQTSSNRSITSTQKKYFIDSIGILTDENKENPEFPYIKMGSIQAIGLKNIAISPEKLDYILKAIKLFKEQFDNMKILNATYKARERELHLCTEKYSEIWIDMEKELEPQLKKLKAAQSLLDMHNNPPIYIDLRISGTNNEKIFYLPRQ